MPRPLPPGRLALALTAAALIAPATSAADPVNEPGWSVTTQDLSSGINLGYETAIDPVNRRLYAADAQPTTRERRPVRDADGNPTGETTYETTVPASGKIVSFNTANHAFLKNWSFLNLLGSDGILGGGFSAWSTPNATTGISTSNNRATSNQPYGVAIDHSTVDAEGDPDPTLVTVQTRTSSVAIFRASAASPTDADVLPSASTGFFRARTPAVDSTRHKAYVVNYNSESGNVAVIDIPTKTVEALIPATGAVGLALDVENNLLYAGTYTTTADEFVRVIDLDAVVTGSPTDPAPNAAAIVANIPGVGLNARPGFDPVGKKLYTANSGDGTVSVVDLDPDSSTYRTVVKTITATGRPNAIAVDPERRLVYSADLGSRLVSVIDAETDEFVQGVPTAGSAIDVDVDPVSGVAYANSQSGGRITAFRVQREADLPQGEPGAPGAPGANGAPGAPGAPGCSRTRGERLAVAAARQGPRRRQSRLGARARRRHGQGGREGRQAHDRDRHAPRHEGRARSG